MKYLTRMQFRVRSGKKRKGRRGVWMIKSKTKYEANYIRNNNDAREMYDMAFAVL